MPPSSFWFLVEDVDVSVFLIKWVFSFFFLSPTKIQIQAAFRTDEIRRSPPTPQDEMRAGMSYFHETIWNGLPLFLRRVDAALKSIGIDERLPYNVPLIQFSSWMGGDRDGECLPLTILQHPFAHFFGNAFTSFKLLWVL
jgi:hypothetical protein